MFNLKTIPAQTLLKAAKPRVLCLFPPFSPAFFAVAILLFTACEHSFTPKQRGYNRIDLPPQTYNILPAGRPYTFEYSSNAVVKTDSSKLSEKYWVDIFYPQFNAEVEITYKPLNGSKQKLIELSEQSRRLVSKHQIKSSGITEEAFPTPDGNLAYTFSLTGQVPSQFQFYTTDSTNHFLRGALYFKTATKNDSLQPVIDFISRDMVHLLRTLQWQKP